MQIKLVSKFLEAINKKKYTDDTEIQNFKIDKSNIHGKGVIATKKIKRPVLSSLNQQATTREKTSSCFFFVMKTPFLTLPSVFV